MSRVTLDITLLTKLQNAGETLELCDNAGRVLGHFVPALAASPAADLEPRISEEEMDRRERAGGGRSLKAILADLERRP